MEKILFLQEKYLMRNRRKIESSLFLSILHHIDVASGLLQMDQCPCRPTSGIGAEAKYNEESVQMAILFCFLFDE